jgi:hypothetical protein
MNFFNHHTDNKVKQLVGKIQSGKTKCAIHICNEIEIPKIVILRNSIEDYKQFNNRLSDTFPEINVKYCGDNPKLEKILLKQVDCVIVCISNAIQLGKIVNTIKMSKRFNGSFDLIIDEADVNAFPKTPKTKLEEYITCLRMYSRQTYYITATPFTCLMNDYDLTNHSIYDINEVLDVIGEDTRNTYYGAENLTYVKMDNIETTLNILDNTEPHEEHPIILLVKQTRFKEEQKQVSNIFNWNM